MGQDRTGQGRAGQDRVGRDGTGRDGTGQGRTGQDRTGQHSSVMSERLIFIFRSLDECDSRSTQLFVCWVMLVQLRSSNVASLRMMVCFGQL